MIGMLRSAFILVAAIAIIGGGTYSYFSTTDQASGTLATGSLSIDLRNQNTTDPFTFSVTNLLPDGTAIVSFDVQNDSGTGVQLRGAAFGSWVGVVSPNNALVKVVKVERYDGGWHDIYDGAGFTGYFYDSPTAADVANSTVSAGGKAQFRLTVKLDPLTGDKYQGKTYNASVKVQARQVGATTWPTSLDAQFE